MPCLEQLLLVAFGLSCFYPGSSRRSCPPSWATLVWDVPPLELEGTGSAPRGLTLPEGLCWGTAALGLLLLAALLCRKARSHWRKGFGRKDGCSCRTSQLLSRLKENPEVLKRYLKHLQKCRTSFVEVFQKRKQENTGLLQGGDNALVSLPTNSQL